MLQCTRQALGTAPFSKLLYSSDGVGLPEIHWASALHGRRILGEALSEVVDHGELSTDEAMAAGSAILRDNARRLYGLD
jgi:predicted TIM-barrel fold metal-dependent hydrolase